MSVTKNLTAAAALIETGWSKGVYARNSEGHIVGTLDPEACRFCALGAILSTLNASPMETVLGALPEVRALEAALPTDFYPGRTIPDRISEFNDAATDKTAVLALFKEAINAHA